MLFISIRDIRKKEILAADIMICAGLSVLRIGFMVYRNEINVFSLMLCLLPGVIMLLISLLSRQSLGYGDGLLALFIGPSLGAGIMCPGIIAAIFLCGICSGVLLILKKAGRGSRLPFVPFMTLGLAVMKLAQI